MLFGAIEEIVVQLTNHAQGQVLEGQSGTVEHLRHVQVVIESRDLDRHFRVLEGLEGLLHQPVKVLPGKVLLSDEHLHHLLDNLWVGQPAIEMWTTFCLRSSKKVKEGQPTPLFQL